MPGDKYGEATRILARHRLTITAPRIAVLNTLLQADGRHFNAEQLCTLMLRGEYEFGLSSFRRAIYDLAGMGPVSRVLVPDQSNRTLTFYELADRPPHRHLYCTRCGTIDEVFDPAYEALLSRHFQRRSLASAQVDSALVGVCADCQQPR